MDFLLFFVVFVYFILSDEPETRKNYGLFILFLLCLFILFADFQIGGEGGFSVAVACSLVSCVES